MQEDEPAQQNESNVDEPAAMQEDQGSVQQVEPAAAEAPAGQDQQNEVLTCPPGMDQEVFDSLPIEMQREVVEQNQVAADIAGQLDAASGLDPEALAALPEDMRREVIEQDQRERQARQQAPANPTNAEEMDNASFIVSFAILLTADDAFLNSLPLNIISQAQVCCANERRHSTSAQIMTVVVPQLSSTDMPKAPVRGMEEPVEADPHKHERSSVLGK